MPSSSLTYVLSYITQEIPSEILQTAFKPRKYSTTVEQRIISEIIEGPILLDANLVGGKRRDIFLSPSWKMDLPSDNTFGIIGEGVESSFYLVPEEAREYRNISSVIGLAPLASSAYIGYSSNSNGSQGSGNTATNMLSEMLNTRTFAQSPPSPTITLEGTNIIRFYPELFIDGVAVSVMLEYDADFLNMSVSSILALRELCLCAVQRYIWTTLRVSIDESEVVAGMDIGVVKDLIVEYGEKAKDYKALLIKLKGAMIFEKRSLSRIIYYGI